MNSLFVLCHFYLRLCDDVTLMKLLYLFSVPEPSDILKVLWDQYHADRLMKLQNQFSDLLIQLFVMNLGIAL